MKKTLLFISCLLSLNFGYAQDGINYQGAVTDSNGDELTSQNITIRASVLSGSANGTLQWQETHATTTDQFGLFSVVIGQGTSTTNGATANFDAMNWGSGNHFLKIEIDAAGGTNYAIIGTTQMMSVPYALYAKSAGSGNMVVSTFGDTLTMNGQSIIVPGISFQNMTPVFGSVTDIDGNTYQTVAHGNIEIMAENLKVESFNNGDPIPEVCYCGTNINSMCSGPGWTFYACQYSNLSYGRLYIGYTIADSRNVCPSGWHIATANEWIQLLDLFVTEYLPNGDVDVSAILSNQSNESGLSILLGGHQGPGGASWANGQQQYESLWYSQGSFSISINVGGFPQNSINPNSNFSGDYNYKYVRCVKD